MNTCRKFHLLRNWNEEGMAAHSSILAWKIPQKSLMGICGLAKSWTLLRNGARNWKKLPIHPVQYWGQGWGDGRRLKCWSWCPVQPELFKSALTNKRTSFILLTTGYKIWKTCRVAQTHSRGIVYTIISPILSDYRILHEEKWVRYQSLWMAGTLRSSCEVVSLD